MESFRVKRVVVDPFGSVTIYGQRVVFEHEVVYLFERQRWLHVVEILAETVDLSNDTLALVGLVVRLNDEDVLEVVALSE